jgi:phage-related minor tail protein
MENQLIQVIKESGVEQQTALTLQNSFLPFFEKANEWAVKAKTLVVTDVSQIREMNMAKQARLALRDIRIEADKTRKLLKEDSLRYGKAVQGVYNVIEYLIVPIEQHLEQQEKFAEIQEMKRKSEIKASREIELQPFAEFVPINIDLLNMIESDYQKVLSGAKLQMQAKIDAEQKAEQERIAKEKAEREERERIRQENERLKKEAAEKAKLEAEIKAKEQSAEKIRKEAEQKAAAELKAKQDAEKKAQSAPDKIKLLAFANSIDALALPELKSEEGKLILKQATEYLSKVTGFIRAKIN